MYSADDKSYLRPGTSEGLSKTRNEKIITLTDVDKARKLPKYDWPERLVYITPAAHRVFTKEERMDNGGETILTTKEDTHFVVIRPKAFVPSTGSVWASKAVMLRHRNSDVFEAKTIVSTAYSAEFRTLCARVNDFTFQYFECQNEKTWLK